MTSDAVAVVGSTRMPYHSLDEMRQIAAVRNEHGAILVRMVETYDPSRQAVVTAATKRKKNPSVRD